MKPTENPLLKNSSQAFTELEKSHFRVRPQLHTERRTRERMKTKARARARRLIRAKNAEPIIRELPKRGATLHGITPGNFVFCDLLSGILNKHGATRSPLIIASLSLSSSNCRALAEHLSELPRLSLELLLSAYFEKTNKPIFQQIGRIAKEYGSRLLITTGRIHTKLSLFDYGRDCWVIETSANLRSSDNIEQFTISNSRPLFNFHRTWIREFRDNPAPSLERESN